MKQALLIAEKTTLLDGQNCNLQFGFSVRQTAAVAAEVNTEAFAYPTWGKQSAGADLALALQSRFLQVPVNLYGMFRYYPTAR